MNDASLTLFGAAYARHRQAEGRDYSGDELAALPYVRSGPLARQWAVRARTFDAFVRHVLRPERTRTGQRLTVLDLGAGNGWLSYRVGREGERAIALDIRTDAIDGLGAAEALADRVGSRMRCVNGSFQSIPLLSDQADIAVFNASLHYATDLESALGEAVRVVRTGGCVAILDSPFYATESDGLAMVGEKHANAATRFGDAADVLLGPPFIEFLTPTRLANASCEFGLQWRRRRVSYPFWYELRPLLARLTGRRRPSRFDLWVARVP
jgi:SAM-dependent methyltransferase